MKLRTSPAAIKAHHGAPSSSQEPQGRYGLGGCPVKPQRARLEELRAGGFVAFFLAPRRPAGEEFP